MNLRHFGLAAAALLALGCQGPARPPAAGPAPSPVELARDAVARRDWAAAAPLLREALTREPESLALRYQLAVTATYLDEHAEAVQQFEWVVAHAPAGSAEAAAARSWLVETGVLSPARRPTPDADDSVGPVSGLGGRVLHPAAGGRTVPAARGQLHLVGLDGTPTAGRNEVIRTDEAGRFEFRGLPAGPYRLTDRAAGEPTWRLRVELEPGREQRLDLTPDNVVSVRDDFPAVR
jgi:hypothetical protein